MTIDCPRCKLTIEFAPNVKGSFDDDTSVEIMDQFRYSLVKCPKCRKAILTIQHTVYELNAFDLSAPTRIFPSSEFHVNNEIPELLRNSLIESIGCYDGKLFTATTIMCRRTLDGYCKLQGAKAQKLAPALKELNTAGVINDDIFTWADQLRLTGNDAAHEIDSNFTEVDAKDVLEFTIAILDYTYSFKDKFDKFSTRQKARKAAAKATTP